MEGAPLFPVLVKDAAFRPPDADCYYVLASDGLYLVRRTDLFSATVRVDGGVPGLVPHTPHIVLDLPRLPRALVERAVGFFRAVYERWDGEAILFIFYAPAEGDRPARFALGAPPQVIRGRFERGRFRADLRLEYTACEKPGPRYRKLGTFHSHANVGPTHSALDAHDELYESGLHLTAGYVDSAVPAFAAAFVVGRTRFVLSPEQILQPFHAARSWPEGWMEQVTVVCHAWSDRHAEGWSDDAVRAHR